MSTNKIDAVDVWDGDLNQHQINDKVIQYVDTINDLSTIKNLRDGLCVFVKSTGESFSFENMFWKPIIINQVNLKSFPRIEGETDDTQRFKRAINSIKQITSNQPPSGITSVTSTHFYIPFGEYIISDEIEFPPYIEIISYEKPTIKQLAAGKDIFVFNDGYSISVKGIRFFNGKYPIVFKNKNLDETMLQVSNCEFHRSESYAIYTLGTASYSEHMSAFIDINNCKFSLCNKVLHNVCDKALLRNSWVYIFMNNFSADSAAIMNKYGQLSIDSLIGVPNLGSPNPYWGGERISNSRWIDNYDVLNCFRCRFGMEADGLTIVHSFGGVSDLLNGMGSCITLRDCQISAGNQQILGLNESGVIRIRSKLPRKIVVENCNYQFETPLIIINDNYDFISYLNSIALEGENFAKYLQENIIISLKNNEKTISNNVVDIPPILSQFVNSGAEITLISNTQVQGNTFLLFNMPIGANGVLYEMEIGFNVNPNGSKLYSHILKYIVMIGTGYNGSNVSFYIQGEKIVSGVTPTSINIGGDNLVITPFFGDDTSGENEKNVIINNGYPALRYFTIKVSGGNNISVKAKLLSVN